MTEDPISVVITFQLPEHEDDLFNAINGWKWKRVVEKMDNYLRGQIKYVDYPIEIQNKLQKVRDQLNELSNDLGLILHE